MKYALCYDIKNDRRRRRVSKLMESYGYRVQESVFEAFLSSSDLKELCERLVKVINREIDDIRVYQLCKECDESIILIGNGERIEQKPFIVL